MAFTQEPTKTPTAIGSLIVELFLPDPSTQELPGASFKVQIKLSDGTTVMRNGDLIPHLTAQQINQLTAFMTELRLKAEDELL